MLFYYYKSHVKENDKKLYLTSKRHQIFIEFGWNWTESTFSQSSDLNPATVTVKKLQFCFPLKPLLRYI